MALGFATLAFLVLTACVAQSVSPATESSKDSLDLPYSSFLPVILLESPEDSIIGYDWRVIPDSIKPSDSVDGFWERFGSGDYALAQREVDSIISQCANATERARFLAWAGVIFYAWAERLATHDSAVYGREKFNASSRLAEEALALVNTDARIWNNYGIALARQGQITDAITMLEKAARTHPQFATYWRNASAACLMAGRYRDACRFADSLITRKLPHGYDHWRTHARAYAALGKYEIALSSIDSAVQHGSTAQLWYERALALFALDRMDDALMSLEGALVIDPSHAESLGLKSSLLLARTKAQTDSALNQQE